MCIRDRYREAAYLLGTAKQTGRISPMDLALAAAPTVLNRTGLGERFAKTQAGEFLLGKKPTTINVADATTNYITTPMSVGGTQGLIGQGGEMFQLGKGFLPGTGPAQDFGLLDTKAGQFL